jgi:cytochrome b561
MSSPAIVTVSAEAHQVRASSPSHDRYTRIAMVLHWMIAAFIVFNLCSGFYIEAWLHGSLMKSAPPQMRWLTLMLHVSSGLTVLLLTVARVAWRLLNPPPPYPATMKPWERHAAHYAHFLLYAAMVIMPLTGWAILSAHPPAGSPAAAIQAAPPAVAPVAAGPAAAAPAPGPRAVYIWNLIPMPSIPIVEGIGWEPGGLAAQHVLHEEFQQWHGVGGYLLLGVLLLHVLGALKHQFIDRQAEFARMGIGRGKGTVRSPPR